MSKSSVGIFLPLHAKSGQGQAVTDFLIGGKKLVDAEPETNEWYGVKFSENEHAIFDTFAADSGRQAHLDGKVAEALIANASTLFATGLDITPVELLVSIVRAESKSTEPKVGLYVPLVAKPEKAEAVKQFLISAGPLVEGEEPETLQWFAYRKSETEFAIFDTNTSESGRNAHLNGKAAAALVANAADLFATPLNIQKFDILASKV
ncbi:hypothetical protein K439DRAFT_1635744 [Ramaria rubella]|nr:hypothetical protein K439DRAFT_1635744 [Ramaria rubella]